MKTFTKISLTILACCLCTPTIAATRFIIKYKLNEAQTSYLLAHSGADKRKAEAQIREQLMEKISTDKIDALSKAAGGTQVEDLHSVATGAHVIILSKSLDKEQTEQFINTVKQDNGVEYIEKDQTAKTSAANPA